MRSQSNFVDKTKDKCCPKDKQQSDNNYILYVTASNNSDKIAIVYGEELIKESFKINGIIIYELDQT